MRLALLWGTTVLVVLATTNADLLARPSTAMPMTSTPSAFAMAQKPRRVTLPAGTRILIRTIDSVDTKNQKTGARFTASLETSLKANGVVVARRGTTIYGRVASAKSAGKFKGSSQLSLELTDIVINGTPCPIVSSTLDMKGRGEGKKTTKKVLGGTGLGALVGGIAGGGTGAAIGAVAGAGAGTAVSASKKGEQVGVPSETLLEFRLEQQVTLPVTR